MLKIRDYEKGDIYQTQASIQSERELKQYIREDSILQGNGFTAISNGKIVACAGLVEVWAGVYECWMVIDEKCRLDCKLIYGILKLLKKTLPELNLPYVQRIGAHVAVTIPKHERLMKFLGFEMEAEIKSYFPGNVDCVIYRKVN